MAQRSVAWQRISFRFLFQMLVYYRHFILLFFLCIYSCANVVVHGNNNQRQSSGNHGNNPNPAASSSNGNTASSSASPSNPSFIQSLMDLGLDQPVVDDTPPIIPLDTFHFASVAGVFVDGDILLLNFSLIIGSVAPRLSRCEFCIDYSVDVNSGPPPSSMGFFERRVSSSSISRSSPLASLIGQRTIVNPSGFSSAPFPNITDFPTTSTGPILESDKWRVNVLKGMPAPQPINSTTTPKPVYNQSALPSGALIQLTSDNGRYLTRINYTTGSEGCSLVHVDGVANTQTTIWEVVSFVSGRRMDQTVYYALREPNTTNYLTYVAGNLDPHIMAKTAVATCPTPTLSGRSETYTALTFVKDLHPSTAWNTPLLTNVGVRAPFADKAYIRLDMYAFVLRAGTQAVNSHVQTWGSPPSDTTYQNVFLTESLSSPSDIWYSSTHTSVIFYRI